MTATRESQAAVALIRHPAGEKFLCQWSTTWKALHFIGGHRDGTESFRECAVREVREELGLAEGTFGVAAEPLARLDYVAFSESAKVPTRYVMEVFPARLRIELDERPENAWLGWDEIARGQADDGRRISPTVGFILGKIGISPLATG